MKGARSLRHLGIAPEDAYALKHVNGTFERGAKDALYSGDFSRRVEGHDPLDSLRRAWRDCGSPDALDRALAEAGRTRAGLVVSVVLAYYALFAEHTTGIRLRRLALSYQHAKAPRRVNVLAAGLLNHHYFDKVSHQILVRKMTREEREAMPA